MHGGVGGRGCKVPSYPDQALIGELGRAGEKPICGKSFTSTIRRRGFFRSFAEAADFSDILLVRPRVAPATFLEMYKVIAGLEWLGVAARTA